MVLVGCGPSVNIWNASAEGNIEAVKQHLSSGTDVNAKDDRGSTPLHSASKDKEGTEFIELLIAKRSATLKLCRSGSLSSLGHYQLKTTLILG